MKVTGCNGLVQTGWKMLLLVAGLVWSVPSWSQDLSQHNWYFGNSVNGIRFNRGTNAAQLVTNQALPFARGGAAVATDPATANLLFYTDGVRVYDANHLPMPNSTLPSLNGQPDANQPVVLSLVPGQTNQYYIFTNSANFPAGGSISRTVVDLAQFGNAIFPAPATGVVTAAKNVAMPGLSNRSEGMIIVPHANRIDYWLITHQNNSQNYSATLIDAGATFPSVPSLGVGVPLSIANFSYHRALGKLAVSPQNPTSNALILNFDDATGAITFDRAILNSANAASNNQSVYDIEWDPKGRYLYLSRHGDTGILANVLQYDYDNPAITLTSALSTPVFRSYGLQLAPDSAIYHLYQATLGGPFRLGRLTNTDTVASEVVNQQGLFGNANFEGMQFPSFRQDSTILTIDFTVRAACQNSPTSFFPLVNPNADSLQWDLGDGNSSGNWSPIHTYEAAGTVNVTMTAFYRGQSQSISKPVTINPFTLELQLVQDTTACRQEFPPPRGSSSPTQFQVTVTVQGGTASSIVWSNGDTGATLRPDSAGYYYVVVTDASGCSAYAGVNVKEYGLQDQRSNVWYFGNRAGIDFNEQPPEALDNSAMNAPEGCAIVCDRNGDAIFYTDGDKVYDKTDTEIDSGIGGDPASAQSALIVPIPGDETLYYIFTTQAINGTAPYEVRYSLFDLKANSGNGGLIEKNILLFSRSTERITSNGRWLIVHEYGNNVFRAYSITPQGIGEPVYSESGSDHAFRTAQNGEGYMKIGARNNIAVALSTPGVSNLVELFQLNDTTGFIGNYRRINLNEPNGQVYGIEFSPGGNKVFATVKGSPSPSLLFEYFLDSLERPFRKQRLSVPGEAGALQIAPDGRVYMALNGSTTLGTIDANDDTTQLSAFTAAGFTLLAGTNSRLGLPNFIQFQGNAFGGPGMEVTGFCLGDSTRFSGLPTDAIDQFQWNFGDGGSSTEASPAHLYAAAGNYTVTLRIFNRCSLDTTMTRVITINPPPALPSVPGAISLCTGTVILDANIPNTPGITHLWSSGETTRTLTLNDPAFITVTNTDANGCSSSAQTIVADNRPQLDLGPDVTICEDNATSALNALNPGANYQWTIDGVNASTAQTQAVDTSAPGVFTYAVTVTDPITTCTLTEDKIFTINVSPSFTLSGLDPTSCGTPTGSITLDLTSPGGGPYSYFLTGPSFNQQGLDQVSPSTVGPITGRTAGTYSAVVTDQISGCTLNNSIGLVDATLTITPTVVDPCLVTYSVAVTGGVSPYRFTFTNSGTGQVIGPSAPSPSPFLSSALPAGNYVLQVQDAGNCIDSVPLLVTPAAAANVTIDQSDLCDATPTLTASGAGSYTWTASVPGAIVGAANVPTIQLQPGLGNVTYTVTSSGGGCPAIVQVTVNVLVPATPFITQTSECSNQVILRAQPGGTFTYRWFRNGTPVDLGQQIAIGVADNGASYRVELRNTVNGCITLSNPFTAVVIGVIDAGLSGTPACDDNQPFTLTATTSATGVTYTWFLNGNQIPSANTASIQQTQAGIYRVEISKGTCMTPAQIQVIKAPVPVGSLLNRVIICNDPDNADPSTASVDLDPGAFESYNWFRGTLPLNYTLRVFTADQEGIYRVMLTNSYGCVAEDQTDVRNDCVPKIVAPNAFRPTSALGTNRDFFVYSFFITDNFQVMIYNRWGELVFESKDKNFKWNGGYNNNASQILPNGTYAYVIRYVSSFRPDKGIQEQRGGVALIR